MGANNITSAVPLIDPKAPCVGTLGMEWDQAAP